MDTGGGEGASSSGSGSSGKLFAGAAFILTGVDRGKDEAARLKAKADLESTLRAQGGAILDIDPATGNLVVDEGSGKKATAMSAHVISRCVNDGMLIMLSDPADGQSVKSTLKLFHGLAFGITPVRPSWVHECIKERRWLPQEAKHRVPTASAAGSSSSSSRRRGAAAAAEPPDPGTLLADYVIVPCFDEKWGPSWKAVLRAAGADLRTDLPTERSNEGGDKTCVVVVVQKPEKDKSHPAGVAGLLERAKAKQVPTASQDWVKHCLLEQKVLELSRFPAVVK